MMNLIKDPYNDVRRCRRSENFFGNDGQYTINRMGIYAGPITYYRSSLNYFFDSKNKTT